ncbi:MAG: esterase [Spirochaetia bacterium]|nr:esterase [Spirochaetia bacterium]
MKNKSDYKERVIEFTAGDGFTCNLIHYQSKKKPTKGPVMLVHGAGVRANLFNAPGRNIIDMLIEEGYDVWNENWRASIDLPKSQWTLDEAAKYDHPAAVKTVLKETGSKTMKAIIHCQGSTSFMMSAVAGLVPEVTTIVSNAVSLFPRVPVKTYIKVLLLTRLLKTITPFLDAKWAEKPDSLLAKGIKLYVNLMYRKCDNRICRMANFMYGTSTETLWLHSQIDEKVHDWAKDEFAHCSTKFLYHIRKCITAGQLVSSANIKGMPKKFADVTPKTKARFAFFAGEKNLLFLAKGQKKSFEHFNKIKKNFHTLHIIPGYSHLDIFIGKKSSTEVLPLIIKELNKNIS